MINPFKEAAPWARLVTLVILGMGAIFAIGRWDARIGQRSAALDAETSSFLSAVRSRYIWRDSVETLIRSLSLVSDSLMRVDSSLTASLDENRRLAQREVEELASTPLDSLLRPLRLRPIRLPEPTPRVVYATDSAGVRLLAGRMLRLAQVERERSSLQLVARIRLQRIEALTGQAGLLAADRDTLTAQLALATTLLGQWQRGSRCRILWIVNCPSRTTSAVMGLVTGAVATLVVIRR